MDLKTGVSFRDRSPRLYTIATSIDLHNLRKPVFDPVLRKSF